MDRSSSFFKEERENVYWVLEVRTIEEKKLVIFFRKYKSRKYLLYFFDLIIESVAAV